MSREIKFRVWEEREKAYNTWSYILDTIGNLFRNAYGALIGCDKKDYIIEQYTGLKDKNGKNIYEGDIVDVSSVFTKPKTKVVEFSEQACGFEPFVNGCPDCYYPLGKDVIVIGNIHENPELLEH